MLSCLRGRVVDMTLGGFAPESWITYQEGPHTNIILLKKISCYDSVRWATAVHRIFFLAVMSTL